MMIDKAGIPHRKDTIIEKLLENEIVLYNQTDHHVHSLNLTAGIIWNLCDGTMTVQAMIDHLLEKCKGDKQLIEEDCLKTLSEMEQKNLITIK